METESVQTIVQDSELSDTEYARELIEFLQESESVDELHDRMEYIHYSLVFHVGLFIKVESEGPPESWMWGYTVGTTVYYGQMNLHDGSVADGEVVPNEVFDSRVENEEFGMIRTSEEVPDEVVRGTEQLKSMGAL